MDDRNIVVDSIDMQLQFIEIALTSLRSMDFNKMKESAINDCYFNNVLKCLTFTREILENLSEDWA